MPYSRIQQFISYTLIVSILFLQTFEIPFLQRAQAEESSNARIVSFIVDEDTYDDFSSEINTYAKDIQGYMDNVRVAVFPVPKTINPYEVASINERLYLQGDEKGLSQLIGTILIGPVPLPVVHKNDKTFLSLYPYTDFDEKAFVYNQDKNYYEYTDKSITTERPEIWHSVISPNTGDSSQDASQLEAFFKKTHDFYTSKGVFSESLSDPYVFYYDGLREQQSARYVPFKMYEEWIKNIEDLTYKRTTKHLLDAVNKTFQSLTENEATSGIDTTNLDPKLQELIGKATNTNNDFSGIPDIMSRQAIDKVLKVFHESINDVYFGDLMKFVFNTGRYGNGQKVRVDTIPFLIDKKDKEMQKVLLTGNNLLEKTIDDAVKSTLSKPIDIKTLKIECDADGIGYVKTRYQNYIEGNKAENITRPEQCSVFRGGTSSGSTLVEADRSFNVDNFQKDTGTKTSGKLMDVFGNHSPYNVDFKTPGYPFSQNAKGEPEINKNNARSPLQDILGSVERKKGEQTKDRGPAEAQSYLDCVPVNYAVDHWYDGSCSSEDNTKKIPSWIEHKSPTQDEYKALTEAKSTPSMPTDRDRYIDFQNQAGSYEKIVYPNLFRYTFNSLSGSLTYAGVLNVLKNNLNKQSAEIGGGVDLYGALSKDQNLLDGVVRHIIWLNLPTPTAKYKYVLENYLDIDGKSQLKDVAHKSDYEMAYVGAPGTTQNMYVRLDPEEKGAASGKIKDILTKVNATKQALDAAKVTLGGPEKPAEFKCGGPEGVILFQWPSAIQCWLKNLMPVGISAGSCSASTLGMTGEETSDENTSSTEDANKNGVPDAAEKIADGYLDLFASKKTAQYGDSINLDAYLYAADGKTLIIGDSFSEVNFEVTKVTSIDGNKRTLVYDSVNPNLSDSGVLADYVNFKPTKIRAQAGTASYVISSKYKDADISLLASILTKDRTGKIVVDTLSNPVILRVRGDSFSVTPKVKSEDTYESSVSIEAGNQFGVVFEFDKTNKNHEPLRLDAPYKLFIYNAVTEQPLFKDPIVIDAKSSESYTFKNPNILNKAGVYRFEFVDDEGFDASQEITVLPAPVAKIQATPASTKFVKGQKTAVLVELLDKFGNLAKGDVHDVKAKLNGVGVFETTQTGDFSQGISEGVFTLAVSADTAGTMGLKISSEGVDSEIVNLEAIDYAKVETSIDDANAIIVGGATHNVHIRITDRSGSPIKGFHTSAAVSVPELAGVLSSNMIDIRDGVSVTPLSLKPYFVSQDDAKLSVQVLGVEESAGNVFTVHPERPVRIGFHDVSHKIEAQDGNVIQVKASIFDRYGNIASYKTEGLTTTLSVPDEYASMIHFTGNVYSKNYLFVKGTAIANVYSSDIPGGAWILAKLNGTIEDEQIETKGPDATTKTITVPAVTEDATKIDTYYFWNSEKLDATKYNTLYTTLFGSSYGDVTQAGYLGGSVVFNPEGRSLAVTTLVNNPYQKNLAFGFTPAGKYISPQSNDNSSFNIKPSIEGGSGRIIVNLYDTLYKETVAKAWIRPDVSSVLSACEGGEGKDIKNCSVSVNSPYILLQGSSSAQAVQNTNSLSLLASGINLFEIGKNGILSQYPGVTLDLDSENNGNYLGIKINFNTATIGYLAIKLPGSSVGAYPSSAFPGVLANDAYNILLEMRSNKYNAVNQYLGNSSAGARGVALYAWSEDSEDYAPDETLLSGGELLGLESALKENGVGWQTGNRMLLEFAAGNGMGDSSKFYQTYSTINLGDPVAHLTPKKHPVTKQDRTIGQQIAEGRGEQIEMYKKLDFNGDNQEDIVIFYESGKVELLANYGGTYKNLGYWAYVPDAIKGIKNVGNFAGPDREGKKFSSIALVSDKTGGLILLENRDGKLVRRDMSSEVKPSSGTSRIRQMEVFDMNKDGADDIVVLFESGELDIFYGGTRVDGAGKRVVTFTKKLVDSSLKIHLSSEKRDDGGAIYFSDLPQLPDSNGQSQTQADFLKDSKKYNSQADEVAKKAKNQPVDMTSINNAIDTGVPTATQDAIFNRYVYYQYAYSADNSQVRASNDIAGITASAGTYPVSGVSGAPSASTIASGWQDIDTFQNQDTTFTPDATETVASRNTKPLTFIRSEYSPAKGIAIEKTYASGTGNIVETGVPITVTVEIKNTSGKTLSNVIYLEEPDPIVHLNDGLHYSFTNAGKTIEGDARELQDGDYTYGIDNFSLAAGATATLKYVGIANPVDIGRINVGILENDDTYGDIALNPSKICGATYTLWKSIGSQIYNKIDKTFTSTATAPVDPDKIIKNSADIVKLYNQLAAATTEGERAKIQADIDKLKSEMSGSSSLFEDSDANGIPDNQDIPDNNASLLSEEGIQALSNTVDDVVKGLGCGFGGGSCWSAPMNYAPLAPGAAPVFMGYPMGTLTPFTGIPVFAAPTTCGPIVVWPPCPAGAGGWLSPPGVSQFRLFWTPTLTGGQGVAICWGSNLSAYALPPGVSPIVPGGNCIVAAAPLNMCKDDGSDGDVSGNGYGNSDSSGSGSTNNSYLNASECKKSTEKLTKEDKQQLIEFARGGSFNREQLQKRLSAFAGNMKSKSLISIGGDESGGLASGSVGIDTDAIRRGDLGGIVKINLKRIFPFPDFIMQWVTRQMEEIVNKLTDLPTLYVILPDFTPLTGQISKVSKTFDDIRKKTKDDVAAQKKIDNKAINNDTFANYVYSSSGTKLSAHQRLNNYARASYANNASGMQEAFALISSLPLIEIDNEELTVDVPWIDGPTIKKKTTEYQNTVKQWQQELDRAKKEWSKLGSASGASSLVAVDVEKSIRSIEKNIKVLDGYAKFPEKLYKLLSWKETFIEQILCNISVIQEVTTGWMSRNGKRFKAWVELYVLIKAILKSWQLVIDVFTGYEAECSACKNERWNLWQFIFKLISMILPQVPIIEFPKWPDIILDLHNIRGGLRVKVPTFDLNPKPIVLPYLPKLSLPDVPSVNIGLPQIPTLPALPALPALPELPSLPRVELPDLPPPPTIPKLFGYIEIFLNILKLIKKVLCLLRINPFVPEWYAGAQIAIITERQGKLPIDFLDVSLPQFSYPWIDAIKVTTYVNLEFDADFIVEFARSLLQPLNQFSTDFSHLGGAIKMPKNIAVPGVDNVNLDVTPQGVGKQGYVPQENLKIAATKFAFGVVKEITKFSAYLEKAKNDTITTTQMKGLLSENIASLEKHGGADGKKIASILRDAVAYDGSKEDKIISDLTSEQQAKWKNIRAILQEHKQENTALKTELEQVMLGKKSLDSLKEFDAFKIGNIQTSANDESPISTLENTLKKSNAQALTKFQNIGKTPDPKVASIKKTGDEINATVKKGMENFSELMAYNAARPTTLAQANLSLDQNDSSVGGSNSSTNGGGSAVSTTNNSASSTASQTNSTTAQGTDQYDYKGLYLLYKDAAGNAKQTHLFDYTDETDGTEEVIPLDVHNNGDQDVLFRIGNGLYIKYAGPNLPNNTQGGTKRYDYKDFLDSSAAQPVQSAVNYFAESFDSPNEINLSFRPANMNRDKKFRMEYFEYIDRFDRRDDGQEEKTMTPFARKEVVDMVTDLSKETTKSTSYSGVTLHDTIAVFGAGSGEGTLTMPKYDIWAPENGVIDIAEGKTLYTKEGATIQYRSDTDGDNWKTITLGQGQNVEFQMSGEMRVITGSIILLRDSIETKVINLGDLKSLPIVAGTRLELSRGDSSVNIKYYQGEDSYLLDNGSAYEYRYLGDVANEYQVDLSRENDFYYAKLYPFASGIRGTVSNLALFAPQIHGDTQPPIVSLGRAFRVPVYQSKIVNLLKYIDDVSGIDRIWVEGDSLIKAGNTVFDLVFGQYTSLFKKSIQFFAQDIPGNVTKQDMTLEVYSPVPQITDVASRVVKGILNEVLKDEPVDIFRYRNEHIDRISGSGVLTDENGQFTYPLGKSASGVVLKDGSGSTLLTINETTGKITLVDKKNALVVLPATLTHRTQVQVTDTKNNILFTQELSFPGNFSIEKTADLNTITADGIYVMAELSGYDIAKNGSEVPGLPYGAYIVDADKKPIAGISRDGNVYIMDSGFSLKYRETGNNIVYLLMNKSNQVVAEILLKMKAEYITK